MAPPFSFTRFFPVIVAILYEMRISAKILIKLNNQDAGVALDVNDVN